MTGDLEGERDGVVEPEELVGEDEIDEDDEMALDGEDLSDA